MPSVLPVVGIIIYLFMEFIPFGYEENGVILDTGNVKVAVLSPALTETLTATPCYYISCRRHILFALVAPINPVIIVNELPVLPLSSPGPLDQ